LGKNVAVFVDVANIFYAAKAAGVDIDYVTLLKSAIAGRDFVRAYAYTGLDPDNENQRNFHDFLRRHDYKVVSKDIRKYGDGKVKANLDIELVVDMMKTARNLDVAIIISGDGDFAPAIRAVQEMGVRVEVISFRGNTSSDLMDVADQFTDIIQIAKVEKGSSRSGRRVATDDEDLSMTEVPDKLSEGTGVGRGRGRGRARPRAGEAEPERTPVARAAGGRGRTRTPAVVESADERPEAPVGTPVGPGRVAAIVALPGEKLSKAAPAAAAPSGAVESAEADDEEPEESPPEAGIGEESEAEAAHRRRRRRGGRGRGRGRGRADEPVLAGEPAQPGVAPSELDEEEVEDEEVVAPSAPRRPRSAAFGSVWDSQIGMDKAPTGDLASLAGVEDEDEPAIPEYLIAEQRRGAGGVRSGAGARGSGRGGRSGGYSAAVDRERYGSAGRPGGSDRYQEPSGRRPSGGSGGGGGGGGFAGGRGARDDRFSREAGPVRARPERPSGGRSDEPWSEVPPELEALLRAQLAAKPKPVGVPRIRSGAPTGSAAPTSVSATPTPEAPAADAAAPKRRSTRPKAAPTSVSAPEAPAADAAAPKRRVVRKQARTDSA
jgi:uncharacterized LabA/DUF88 family protein